MQHDHVAHDVLQLTDVPGPVIGQQAGFNLWREGCEGFVFLGRELAQEALGNQHDILATLSQRRHADRDNVEAVV